MAHSLICGECLLRGVYMPLRMTEPPTCPVCGSRAGMGVVPPPVVHIRSYYGGRQCDMFGMPRTCVSARASVPWHLITCRDCLLAELRTCINLDRVDLADIVKQRCIELSNAEHAFGWNGKEWRFDFHAAPNAEPRIHLALDAKGGAQGESWCPWCPRPANGSFVMAGDISAATCLECLNLALDQAIHDNDSVIAAALIDRRKLLPNYKARKAARGEAYHATKVPQPIVMSNWPGLQQTAKRSHEQMREIAMNQVDAAASNFSTRRMAADILYLLEESEALQLELAQAQMNLANEKMMRATDPFAARIAGMSLGVEFDSRAASQAGLPFVTSVRNCSRCKGEHNRISFRRILNPDDRGNWYAICPMTEQPILLVAKHRA